MNYKVLFPVLWTLIIVILSVIPPPIHGPEASKLFDLGHVVSYALLTILWIWSLRSKVYALLISLVMTPLTELVQLPLPWRNANLIDVLNNALGVLVGIVFYRVVIHFV